MFATVRQSTIFVLLTLLVTVFLVPVFSWSHTLQNQPQIGDPRDPSATEGDPLDSNDCTDPVDPVHGGNDQLHLPQAGETTLIAPVFVLPFVGTTNLLRVDFIGGVPVLNFFKLQADAPVKVQRSGGVHAD